MDNKTKIIKIVTDEYDVEDFNTESDDIDSILARDGVDYDPNGELIHVDTPWALGFVNREGECMN